MSANFVEFEQDDFNPEYGGVKWKRRLNAKLEEVGAEIEPVGYAEEGKPAMQVTQENTIMYINQVADELDCVAVRYAEDGGDIYTWYFRHKFGSDEVFARVVGVVGPWAMQIIIMYPLEHVVNQYEAFMDADIPDELPDDMV